jgi:hypothetical protein
MPAGRAPARRRSRADESQTSPLQATPAGRLGPNSSIIGPACLSQVVGQNMTSPKKSLGQWRVAIVRAGFVLAAISGAVFLVLSVVAPHVESPAVQRLSAMIDREVEFDFEPLHFPPYEFLIGVKGASMECPAFEGAITISGPDGKVTKISIDSGSSQVSNWLHDPSETGYILTWFKDPSLSDILVRGRSYRVQVRLEEPLPSASSLWFSSMRHIPLLGKEEAQR